MQTKMTDHTEQDLGSYDTFSCDNVYFKTTNYFVRPFIPYVYMEICSLTLLHSTILSAKRLMGPINMSLQNSGLSELSDNKTTKTVEKAVIFLVPLKVS